MKALLIISIFLLPFRGWGQLFTLKKQKIDTTLSQDSAYFKYIRLRTTVEDSVFILEDLRSGKRNEMAECKCIDMKGKNIGDTIVISQKQYDAMISAASSNRKRKTSRKSDLEN